MGYTLLYVGFLMGLVLIMLGCEYIYIRIAERLKILANISSRSSHSHPTVTGGGIIFYASIVFLEIYSICTTGNTVYPLAFAGLSIVALVSFFDDVKPLNPLIRLIAQILGIMLIYAQLKFLGFSMTPFLSVIIIFCGVAFINAYNFMDGIMGITGCYSIVVLSVLFYCSTHFDDSFIIYPLAAVIAFAAFNFHKHERCFAGDVGSISMGYIIYFVLIYYAFNVNPDLSHLSDITPDLTVVTLVIVYVADFSFTLIRRIIQRENILKPHRKHLYQILANEYHIPHFAIALSYATVQLIISVLYIFSIIPHTWIAVSAILAILLTTYIFLLILRDRAIPHS